MAYEAGNLLVTINGSAQGANASINSTIKHLNSLKTAITQLTSIETTASSKIVAFFTDLGNGIKKIDSTALAGIANLGASIKSLSSITGLTKLEKLDWGKVANGFSKLTTAITPFVNKVKEAEVSLNALYGILQKSSGKKIQGLLGGETASAASNFNKLFNIAKIRMFYYYARRVGSAVANIVQYGVDYTETLNLWTVAMRDNLSQADEFIKKMNRAYGISEQTLMNSQAIFKNMLGSLGQISSDTAYALSEALVQMSADFASLYNVPFETALSKMQAMLAGQVRPIRIAGLDITETTLYQFYQELGGTKTMRQLNRTEKQLLSILAVFKQMGRAGALGDMQKTLNQFANQSRMINDNFKTMLTWAGVIGKSWIENTGILVYINALLITMGDILKAVAMSMHAIDSSDFLETEYDNTQNTNKALDELQGKLLDFDKFRALNSAEDNQTGLIDKSIIEAITGYKDVIDETENEARMLADTWLKWWTNDDGTLTENAKNLLAILKDIRIVLSSIALIGGGMKLASTIKGIQGAVGALSLFGTIKESIALISLASSAGLGLAETAEGVGGVSKGVLGLSKAIKFLLSPLGIVLALVGYLFVTNEEFRGSILKIVNIALKPLTSILTVVINIIGTLLRVVNAVLQPIGTFIAQIVEFLDKAGLLEPLIYGILGAVALIKIDSIIAVIKKVTSAISSLAIKIFELIKTSITKWASSIKTNLAGVGKQALITQTVGIAGLVAGIAGLVYVFQNWGNLETWQKVIGLLGAVTAAALGAALAFGAFHSAWSIGLAVGGIVAGIAAVAAVMATTKKDIENMDINFHALGASNIDGGSLFVAGEMGRTEMVYNGANGKSNVANIAQIREATAEGTYDALVRFSRENRGTNTPIQVNINGKPVFNAVRTEANKVGLDFSRR